MSEQLFDAFQSVLSTAAGNACRCSRSELAQTIATIAPNAEFFTHEGVLTTWDGLATDLEPHGITVRTDSSPETTRDQPWGLTGATAAIAETGSVILHENRLDQRSVSLMTQGLIVLCPLDQLLPSLDDAANVLRAIGQDGTSYATFVSGPSRTADIERELSIGVQGPGELHVIFIKGD